MAAARLCALLSPLPRLLLILSLAAAVEPHKPEPPSYVGALTDALVPDSFLAASRAQDPSQSNEGSALEEAPIDVAIVVDYSTGAPAFMSHGSLWRSLGGPLAAAGHNVTVLFASVEGVDGVEQAAERARKEMRLLGVQVHTLPKHKLRYSAPAHAAASYDVYLWLAAARVQLAYFTDWQGLGYYSGAAKSQGLALQDTMLVTLVTGPRIWHAEQPGGTSALASPTDLEVAYMEAAAAERSDAVIATSPEMLSWLQGRGWKLPPVALSSGFFPISPLETLPPPPKQTLWERLGGNQDAGAVELVFIGALTVQSGLPLFCSAVKEMLKQGNQGLPPLRVAFIGPATKPMFRARVGEADTTGRAYVEEQVEQWKGLRDPSVLSVEFLEDLETPQILSYMATPGRKRLAVLPSPAESGGFTLAELLLQGVPVLATNTTAARELIAAEDQELSLATPVARRLAASIEAALGAPELPVPRPSAALLGARAAWSSWHAALARTKAALAAESGEEGQEGAAALFAPGVEVLVSSFDRNDAEVDGDAKRRAPEAPKGGWPTVTVVLVTYNRPSLLFVALQSLRQQDYPEDRFSVVLVDDGSQDPQAVAFLDELGAEGHWFKKRGWRVVRSPGGYLGNARNRGLEAATGEWVMFMDDDNAAKPHELTTFIRAAIASGADVLTCFNDYLPDDTAAPDRSTVPAGRYVPLGPSSTAAAFRNSIGDANAMFRRSVLVDLGGWAEDDAYAVQDWELFSSALLQGHKVEVVPEALYWYRTNSGSMIRNKLYGVTKALYMRSFLRHGDPALSPAVAVAAQQAEDAALLRQQVARLDAAVSSQGQLLSLMAKESCKGTKAWELPSGNRLRASVFESWTAEGTAEDWDMYEGAGYGPSKESRPGAFGSPSAESGWHSINVTLTNIGQAGGAIQHLMVGQTVARPLLLQGWSKVSQLLGGSGLPADYSIYTDITYQDGSHRWAFSIPMDPAAEGWQHGWAVIDAPKPIRIITVVTMFRWFEGTVLFDDLMLTDVAEGMCHVPVAADSPDASSETE